MHGKKNYDNRTVLLSRRLYVKKNCFQVWNYKRTCRFKTYRIWSWYVRNSKSLTESFFLAKRPFQSSKHTYKHGITHLRLLFAVLARISSPPLSSISYCGLLLSPVRDRIKIIIQNKIITLSLRKSQYRQVEGKLDRVDQRFSERRKAG